VDDHNEEKPTSASGELTDEQLAEVAGGSAAPSAPMPDANRMKPYPPWPGSLQSTETEPT
jgi:hypothetical protein